MITVFDNLTLARLPNGRTVTAKLLHPVVDADPKVEEPDLLGIALLARVNPIGNHLNRKTVATVVRNHAAFRRIAQEAPQLLPLMLAFYLKQRYDDPIRAAEPVLGLKNAIREDGLSEASWRYVVRHGSRLFRIPWKISGGLAPFDAAICYLNTLQFAGLPPPPPPSVAQTLLHVYNAHWGHFAHLERHCAYKIDPVALRAGLLEANRRRLNGTLDGFVDEFLGVCWWAEGGLLLDDNQIKAGWRWFARQWKKAEAAKHRYAELKSRTWTNRLSEFESERLSIIPIQSTEELVDESMALRNCLTRYADDCASGAVEIYSCRNPITGKRIGCIGVRITAGKPELFDVRGFANLPPTRDVQRVADNLPARFVLPPALMPGIPREHWHLGISQLPDGMPVDRAD